MNKTKMKFFGFSGDDKVLLNNTDRGFRLESYLDVSTGTGIYQYAQTDAFQALEREIELYQEDCPRIAQVYFYLTAYQEKELDKLAFENMEKYFSLLKKHKIKALLRFSYIWKDRDVQSQEPKMKWILKHLEQLSPFLHENQAQIHALQAGIVGAWGEWAFKARERTDETQILKKLLEVTPEDMFIQVRYLNVRNRNIAVGSKEFQRIGFHDDFLIGLPHVWNSAGKNENSFEYLQLEEDSKKVLVDGEMIWWWANPIYLPTKTIDAEMMAKRLKNGHFTSLSLSHNYREMEFGSFEKQTWINELRRNGLPDSKYDELLEEDFPSFSSMNAWKEKELTLNDILENGFPVQTEWFIDGEGNLRKRSYYEYLRDYLGYRIQVEEIKIENNQLIVCLKNYGFAAPVGLKGIYIVLMDTEGKEIRRASSAELDKFQTLEKVECSFLISDQEKLEIGKTLHLGILMESMDGTGNLLANDGVEKVGEINQLL